LVCCFVSGVPSGRTNNYPESGRGLGHVIPTIFGIRSNISLKLLEQEISNLIHGFVWAIPSRCINNFPESRRGLGHVTLTIFGSTVGYPSDSLASCYTCILFFFVFNYCLNVFYPALFFDTRRRFCRVCFVNRQQTHGVNAFSIINNET